MPSPGLPPGPGSRGRGDEHGRVGRRTTASGQRQLHRGVRVALRGTRPPCAGSTRTSARRSRPRLAATREPPDRLLLGHCRGATLDVGCGPGRMSAQLAELGHSVLAVDVVPEAVDLARARGVAALQRNVFDPMPGEGCWDTVLLADGNIGIGGAARRAAASLRRAARAGRTGRRRPGRSRHRAAASTTRGWSPCRQRVARRSRGPRSGPRRSGGSPRPRGLGVARAGEHRGRWFAVLVR